MSVKAWAPWARKVFGRTFASVALLGQLVAFSGCGGSKEAAAPPSMAPVEPAEQQLAAPPIENVQAPITHVERAEVDAAIEAGVGRFIQGFDMVEELDEYDRFVGWKIGKIHDRQKFEGLGIGTGDVITTINGLPLERPAHVYEVLMSLKTAQSIDIEYLRGGRVMRLSLPILNDSSPSEKVDDAAGSKENKAGAAPDPRDEGRAEEKAKGDEDRKPSPGEKKKPEE